MLTIESEAGGVNMAHVMDVWTECHEKERVISISPELAAIHYAEDHFLQRANLTIWVFDAYLQETYEFQANKLDYGYDCLDWDRRKE